jgi:hypothetical protein
VRPAERHVFLVCAWQSTCRIVFAPCGKALSNAAGRIQIDRLSLTTCGMHRPVGEGLAVDRLRARQGSCNPVPRLGVLTDPCQTPAKVSVCRAVLPCFLPTLYGPPVAFTLVRSPGPPKLPQPLYNSAPPMIRRRQVVRSPLISARQVQLRFV